MVDHQALTKLLEVYDLPTLPVIVSKVLETLADETSSAADLTELLEKDHAISARVLRLANSAFYGLRQQVDSIRRGVVVLGFNEIRNLALATSVFDTFAKRRQFAFDPEDFWMHSFGAAKAAQILTDNYCQADSHEGCFTASLLHDIGKYVLALILKTDYQQIVEEAQQSCRPLTEVELDKLGMSHARVGRWLAEKWRFPPIIVNVISNLERVTTYSGADKRSVAVVALADHLSRKAGFGFAGDPEDPVMERQLSALLDITQEQMEAAMAEVSPLRDETRQFLNLLAQEQAQ